MNFTWRSFLDYAIANKSHKDEAVLRTAISRAYYAAYHIARLATENRYHQRFDGLNMHAQLWNFLKYDRAVSSEHKQAGLRGANLRDLRRQADYEIDPKLFWQREVEGACLSAESIITSMQGRRHVN